MTLYIGCLLLAIVLYPFFYRFRTEDLERKKQPQLYFVVIAAIFVLLVGLRSRQVGLDTKTYYIIYRPYIESPFLKVRFGLFNETGYALLNWFCANYFGGFQTVLFVAAILSIVPVAILIYKHSDMPMLSWFFYVAFGFYTFTFSTIRQGIAMGITMLAFLCIPKKKVIWFYVLVLVAISFHNTAAIVLPMYWLSKLKIDFKTMAAFICGGILLYIFRNPIREFLSNYANNYYFAMDTGGNNQFLFIVLMLITAFAMRENLINSNSVNKLVFFTVATTGAMFMMLKVNPTLFRLYYYYYIYVILLIPNQIRAIKAQSVRYGFTAAYIFVGAYFFYTQVLTADLSIIPYSFFWQW